MEEIPPSSYTIIHKNAILSPDKKLALNSWAAAVSDSIKANNPAYILVNKRHPTCQIIQFWLFKTV